MRAQSHLWVLELFQESLVKFLSDTIELHYVQWILFNPEFVEFMH